MNWASKTDEKDHKTPWICTCKTVQGRQDCYMQCDVVLLVRIELSLPRS